ncbi:S41 family peptidase [Uliginosibacterium gangwonense]|uniref:S41 family peptidase n=1 Tax=Uliginosibacterium gangwonense TaxID=392736 RepID=UPI00146BFC85|nr:S41 family peptidase [Uliginosibacterium gangwonense]
MKTNLLVLPLLIATSILAGCGGGGGGSSNTTTTTDCSTLGQLRFVRQHVDDKYLFYQYAGTTRPENYPYSPIQYFEDITVNTIPSIDRFSYAIPTSQAYSSLQEGQSMDLGIRGEYDQNNALRISYIEPNSSAATAGLQRGDQIIAINGSTVTSAGVTQAQYDALFASPSGTYVSITYLHPGNAASTAVNLRTTTYADTPVPFIGVATLGTGGATKKAGYLVFNEHTVPAEGQLADAFNSLAQANVTDLILDLRYNRGGYTAIASEVAYMIAGSTATSKKVFEYVLHNDKHSAEDYYEPFYNAMGLTTGRYAEKLPALNLSRVYVLTSASTCSASEMIINGLRGIDIPVIIVGGTTCGKPYGMQQADYCGTSYFALQFQTANAKNEGGYISGFTPSCTASDDLAHQLGDSNEQMLSMALNHISTGQCSTGSPSTAIASTAGKRSTLKPVVPPQHAGAVILPQR